MFKVKIFQDFLLKIEFFKVVIVKKYHSQKLCRKGFKIFISNIAFY